VKPPGKRASARASRGGAADEVPGNRGRRTAGPAGPAGGRARRRGLASARRCNRGRRPTVQRDYRWKPPGKRASARAAGDGRRDGIARLAGASWFSRERMLRRAGAAGQGDLVARRSGCSGGNRRACFGTNGGSWRGSRGRGTSKRAHTGLRVALRCGAGLVGRQLAPCWSGRRGPAGKRASARARAGEQRSRRWTGILQRPCPKAALRRGGGTRTAQHVAWRGGSGKLCGQRASARGSRSRPVPRSRDRRASGRARGSAAPSGVARQRAEPGSSSSGAVVSEPRGARTSVRTPRGAAAIEGSALAGRPQRVTKSCFGAAAGHGQAGTSPAGAEHAGEAAHGPRSRRGDARGRRGRRTGEPTPS
jgi:hypothetical protein